MRWIWNALCSFWLTCLVLIGLMWLTVIGTLTQQPDMLGLHRSQLVYFNSFVVTTTLGSVQIPVFPGGQSLMLLLFVNLVCGGLVRLRKGWRTAGIMITHCGMLLLLASGFVKYWMADEGFLLLHEGDKANWYESQHEWEIAVREKVAGSQVTEHRIDEARFRGAHAGAPAVFTAAQLPFAVEVHEVLENCQPAQKGPMAPARSRVFDGYFLKDLGPHHEHERQAMGLVLALAERGGAQRNESVLWGLSDVPWVVQSAGRRFEIELRRKRYDLPFTLRLDDARHETHARSTMAKSYESTVTKVFDAREQRVEIRMNEPLRHGDYIVFQSTMGGGGDEGGQYSGFSIVRNPSDQWPMWACFVIGFGLFVHFVAKLFKYVRATWETA